MVWFNLLICIIFVSELESSTILSACLRWSSVTIASLAILVMPYTLVFSISLHKMSNTWSTFPKSLYFPWSDSQSPLPFWKCDQTHLQYLYFARTRPLFLFLSQAIFPCRATHRFQASPTTLLLLSWSRDDQYCWYVFWTLRVAKEEGHTWLCLSSKRREGIWLEEVDIDAMLGLS